jgi:hypothetical protein
MCGSSSDCDELLRRWIEHNASSQPPQRAGGARCFPDKSSSAGAGACGCGTDDYEIELSVGGPECILTSRLGGSAGCVLRLGEFSGCAVDEVGSCDAVCADLVDRMNRDRARVYQMKARTTECLNAGKAEAMCRSVVEIDANVTRARIPQLPKLSTAR